MTQSFFNSPNPSIAGEIEVHTGTDNDIQLLNHNDSLLDNSEPCISATNISESFSSAVCDIHNYSKQGRLSRKRSRNECNWKQNVRKRRRQEGQEYETKLGKRVPMRVSVQADCHCKYKCKYKINATDRETVFQSYWAKSFEAQRLFLQTNVQSYPKKRKSSAKRDSRRNNTYQYLLPVNQNSEQVCKACF